MEQENYADVNMTSAEQEVWLSLEPVTDPELDESVVELKFVKQVVVQGSEVLVKFHLPTYWCAANFAYMMALDMREAINRLSWVSSVRIELLEHMYADTINRGIAENSSFQDTFGDEASDEISVVRDTFRKKAFQQRQELLLRKLLEFGTTNEGLVSMTMEELINWPVETPADKKLLNRYIEIRHEWGGDAHLSARAFVQLTGEPLVTGDLDKYLKKLRGVRINTQFNGELCRGLLRARYGTSGAQAEEIRMQFHPRSELSS